MTQEKTVDKDTKNKKTREKRDAPPTKVIIRSLPPTMTGEAFLEQIDPVPEHDYLQFYKADNSLGPYATSRAYINFINQEDIRIFQEKFDGYVFLDNKGHEYSAVVEFAPFQKVPKKKAKKIDPKNNTIDKDSDYLKFLANLEAPSSEPPAAPEAILEEIEARERELKANTGKVSTPLLDYLKRRRDDKAAAFLRQREERKRREIEKRKQRDEERRKKIKENMMKDRKREESADNKTEEKQFKLLKNPEREKERERKNSEEKNNSTGTKEKDRPFNKDKAKPLRDRERDKPRERDRNSRSERDRRQNRDQDYDDDERVPNYSKKDDSRRESYKESKHVEKEREKFKEREKARIKEREREKDRLREREKERERDRNRNRKSVDEKEKSKEDKESDSDRPRSGKSEKISKSENTSEAETKAEPEQSKKSDKPSVEKDIDDEKGTKTGQDTNKPDEHKASANESVDQPAASSATPVTDSGKSDKSGDDVKSEAISKKEEARLRQRIRNKDRPERAIYVPGQRRRLAEQASTKDKSSPSVSPEHKPKSSSSAEVSPREESSS